MTLVVSSQRHHDFHQLGILQPDLVRAWDLPTLLHRELIDPLLVRGHLIEGDLLVSTPRAEVRIRGHVLVPLYPVKRKYDRVTTFANSVSQLRRVMTVTRR